MNVRNEGSDLFFFRNTSFKAQTSLVISLVVIPINLEKLATTKDSPIHTKRRKFTEKYIFLTPILIIQ